MSLIENVRIKACPPGARNVPLALSPSQERIWFLEQLFPGRSFNHLSVGLRLQGALDTPALETSLADLIQRHETLRIAIRSSSGGPEALITTQPMLCVQIVDLSLLACSQQTERTLELARAEMEHPFDLSHGPLLRAKLLRFAPEDHLLLLTVHGIAADSRSLKILCRDWAVLYEARLSGRTAVLPELPRTYFDYVYGQHPDRREEPLATDLAYWKQKLGGRLPVLDIPADRSRPPVKGYRGAVEHFALRSDLFAPLQRLSQRSGVPMQQLLLSAFGALLYRWTGQADMLIGWGVGGRHHEGAELLVGPLANLLPLRLDASGEPGFSMLLERVHKAAEEAWQHQELSFAKLLEEVQPERDLSRSPLFQAAFQMEDSPPPCLELAGLSISPSLIDTSAALVDLTLTIQQQPGGLMGTIVYDTDLFDAATIQRMIGHFQTLLISAVSDPEQPIGRVPILTQAERQTLLFGWNDTAVAYPSSKCIHQLFEEQVQRTPDAVAAIYEDRQLTYRQLNEKADQLALELQGLGVGPEVRVGICIMRSLEMVIGLYAIHKAGGGYVPMDPSYPTDRLAFMLEDAQVPVLLTQHTLLGKLPATTAKLVYLDSLASDALTNRQTPPASPVGQRPTPDNLAYLIYTSGSTGKPKGVMVRHRNVVNFFTGMDLAIGSEPGVWLAVTSISFDIHVLELFWALTRGFTVVIQASESAAARVQSAQEPSSKNASYTIPQQILRHGVTHLQCTPSLATMLAQDPQTLEALRQVKRFFFGGEALPPALVHQLAGGGEIFNMYGPTETTVWSTVHPVTRGGNSISIGRPIANTQIYILDRYGEPVPAGVPGELYIGGEGVVRGYLNRPELTEERFVPNPFSDDRRARMYRTGDLARFKADGTIEFLGRLDFQVKIRGFRIELGEIEAALREHPAIKESVVSLWEAGASDKRLAGYFVAQPGTDPKPIELRRFLKAKLPDYMIPSVMIRLEALPLTPNGKVDRKALPPPEAARLAPEIAFVPPQTRVEETIARVWEELLRVQAVGLHDNFFDLGGNSLLAVKVQARLCQELGMHFPLMRLFQFCTVAALARVLPEEEPGCLIPRDTQESGLTPSDKPSARADSEALYTDEGPGEIIKTLPVTEAQREIWYGSQIGRQVSCSFNQSVILQLRGQLDLRRLTGTLRWLADRHEALRITFSVTGDAQHLHSAMPVEVTIVDLSLLTPESRIAELHRLLQEEVSEPFDLAAGPLFRTRLVKLTADEHALMLTLHHIICDGGSLGILLQEIGERYSAEGKQAAGPPDLPLSYSQFVLEQEAAMRSPERAASETFWLGRYSRPAPALELPTDWPRATRRQFTGSSATLRLSRSLSQDLKGLSARQRCTLVTTLLAVHYLLLHRLSGQTDVVIGLPMTSRSGEGGERLVGHCVNFLPLRLSLEDDPSFSEHLRRVWNVLLEAHEHQSFTLGSLLRKLNLPRDPTRMPLVSVMFNLDWVQEPIELEGLKTEVKPNPFCFARFDLSLGVAECDGQLELYSHYSAELFNEDTIQRWFRHYQALLTAVVANPEQRISQLPRLYSPDGRLEVFAPAEKPVGDATAPTRTETQQVSEAPSGPTEEALAKIWREVILVNEVGRNDNFFDLGGHSLLATQVISRITATFDVEVPLGTIFEAPTIAELAEAVARARREQPSGASKITRRKQGAEIRKLQERLNQLSDAELQELLKNPQPGDI